MFECTLTAQCRFSIVVLFVCNRVGGNGCQLRPSCGEPHIRHIQPPRPRVIRSELNVTLIARLRVRAGRTRQIETQSQRVICRKGCGACCAGSVPFGWHTVTRQGIGRIQVCHFENLSARRFAFFHRHHETYCELQLSGSKQYIPR